jgi:hypothetical protein
MDEEEAYHIFLHSDLAETCQPHLSPHRDTISDVLQVMDIWNASQSAYHQLEAIERLRDEDHPGRVLVTEEDQQQQEEAPSFKKTDKFKAPISIAASALLRLTLSDGVNTVEAMTVRPVNFLHCDLPLGVKVGAIPCII